MNNLIVSRHKGLVDWLKDRGIEGEIISHVTDPTILRGRKVYGVLPLSLAAEAMEVWEVAMPNLQPEQRGKELSIEEMDNAGACLRCYVVTKKY
jgi:putative CRISPR-associated protein (TIGR02620 family)